ncbi:MAG: hypothetical protein P4N60_24780 [Verrucomicrobiae bacterium]|nr:hypothetical protein [Verrucomicrobiae bacterium]
MDSKAANLWSAWHSSPEIRDFAQAWIAKPADGWAEADEQLSGWIHQDPDRALSAMFAIMQLTDDKKILGGLAAGRLEDFLGVQGESYLDIFHSLALQHQKLREVLDGVWQGAMPKRVWHKIEILKQSAFS